MDDSYRIEIDRVSKHYGSRERGVLALREVSLSVRTGEFLSIIGPSGCGKSTLLRLIGDLLAPDSGAIRVNGHAPAVARRARDTALVFQSPTLMEWRTIRNNIALPLEIQGVPPSERERRTTQGLELIRLGEFAARYPHELSIGMQQQVSIARALAYRPLILLMDEPFGALDELTRERLGRELLEIWKRTQVTIVFVTHSIGEAVMLSDRVAVLTPRPGHVQRVVDIDLPRPRKPEMAESPQFAAKMHAVRAALHASAQIHDEVRGA